MTLSATLSTAQSALQTNAAQTTVVSRNIAGVNDPNYSRKLANVSTAADGSAVLVSTTRATDDAVFTNLLSSTAEASASQALADGLDQLERTVNLSDSASTTTNNSTGSSPAALIGAVTNALQQYAASPGDTASGTAFLSKAQSAAAGLNAASTTVQSIRKQADTSIGLAVKDVNDLLGQFQTVNATIVKGTATGTDVTDALDTRNSILKSLSKDIGVTTTTGSDGSMAIYTDSGATLFQGQPRSVTFTPTTTFADGTVANAVSVDGVPVTGTSAIMPIRSGSIAGLTTLRDTTTVSYQNQLNQIASGLITAFADKDQTGGSAPTIPGLFTYSGAPAMPTTGQTGLAAGITVNSNADPSKGGSLARMRDGNVGNPSNAAYNANPSGAASYSTHLNSLLTSLSTSQTFDPASGAAATGTVAAYAASSVSWLEAKRSDATTTAAGKAAVVAQTTTSLSNATGVSLDEQLSLMLDLEHSYQASAQLLNTVNSMYTSLLSSFG